MLSIRTNRKQSFSGRIRLIVLDNPHSLSKDENKLLCTIYRGQDRINEIQVIDKGDTYIGAVTII